MAKIEEIENNEAKKIEGAANKEANNKANKGRKTRRQTKRNKRH